MTLRTVASDEAPPIHITSVDYDLVAELAIRLEAHNPKLSALILNEIDRAHIHETSDSLPDIVDIGSEVTFADGINGSKRTVTLVLPGQADIEKGRISVLTSVGAGLLGMRVGSTIEWPCPDGRPRTLTILRVTPSET